MIFLTLSFTYYASNKQARSGSYFGTLWNKGKCFKKNPKNDSVAFNWLLNLTRVHASVFKHLHFQTHASLMCSQLVHTQTHLYTETHTRIRTLSHAGSPVGVRKPDTERSGPVILL